METRGRFEAFLVKLPDLIRERKVWPNPPKPGGPSGQDTIALAIREWLQEFGLADHITLYAEGMLDEYQIPRVPTELKKGGFCGSWNNPNIALVHPELKVAIEVDRARRGKGGADVRVAMNKAASAS